MKKNISQVQRQVFINDMQLKNFEEAADGPVQLTFNDNSILTQTSLTEVNSIGISFVKIIKSIYVDINNVMEFAIKFELTNGSFFTIEYISDVEYDDMLVISKSIVFDDSNEILVSN